MRAHESICLGIPEILLPRDGIDLTKWAVIACDQYTSEPDYWQNVASFVGGAPSALNLIYPEVYLNAPDREDRISRIRRAMDGYLAEGLFKAIEGLVYVERAIATGTRKGLMVCLDLEHYDFRKGATSFIRATEGTILERIPPRVKIREGAPLEIPHIMVLIDDPGDTVIGPLAANRAGLEKIYDFELMMDSGHLAGYRVGDRELEAGVVRGLAALADPESFTKKYALGPGKPVLLYAMGDGNHSLATAKAIWEKTKGAASDRKKIMASPLRYALVELVNLHDEALVFEPIHRILFGLAPGASLFDRMNEFYCGRCRTAAVNDPEALKAAVDGQKEGSHKIGLVTASGFEVIEVEGPDSNLPVGTLQNFLDVFIKNKAVILDGALPRKTFSMGEAREKRFYMETRRLT